MGQKAGPRKQSVERVVKEIRRVTRRQFSAEEKIRIVLAGLRVEKHSKPARLPERSTATASWGRSILIIAVLSMLSWVAIALIVIALLSLV